MKTGCAVLSVIFLFMVEIWNCSAYQQDGSALIRKLQKIRSFDDIIKNFNLKDGLKIHTAKIGKSGIPVFTKKGRGRDSNYRLEVQNIAKQAPCKPRKKIFETSSFKFAGASVLWPRCITYKVCGGCCTDMTRECGPKKLVERTKHVLAVNHKDSTVSFKRHRYQEHTQCGCDECKVKAHHCRGRETYLPDECRCECKLGNQYCPTDKQWSPSACNCICSNYHEQSKCVGRNFVWDEEYCRCAQIQPFSH